MKTPTGPVPAAGPAPVPDSRYRCARPVSGARRPACRAPTAERKEAGGFSNVSGHKNDAHFGSETVWHARVRAPDAVEYTDFTVTVGTRKQRRAHPTSARYLHEAPFRLTFRALALRYAMLSTHAIACAIIEDRFISIPNLHLSALLVILKSRLKVRTLLH